MVEPKIFFRVIVTLGRAAYPAGFTLIRSKGSTRQGVSERGQCGSVSYATVDHIRTEHEVGPRLEPVHHSAEFQDTFILTFVGDYILEKFSFHTRIGRGDNCIQCWFRWLSLRLGTSNPFYAPSSFIPIMRNATFR